MLSIILKYVLLTFVKKYLKMKKIIFLLILPSLIFAQENQTIVDINNETETKRKKFIGGLSAFRYDANTEDQTKQSLSLGYVILNNLYVGANIGTEGLNLVNRIYLGDEVDIYFTSKYKGNIEHGRTLKFGMGGELFLNKFLSINSELLIYNYKREDTKTTTSVNLNEFLIDLNSGISTSQEHINENYSGGIMFIGLQIHF